MSKYKCHKCGFESEGKRACPECKVVLESECPVCGSAREACTCTGDIVSTKDPKQAH